MDVNRVLIRGQNISLPDSPLPENAPFIANGEVIMVIHNENRKIIHFYLPIYCRLERKSLIVHLVLELQLK